jgi:Ca2+-binding RTX toxin-like protein
MQMPSRRTRVAMLAAGATLALAAPASADPVAALDAAGKLTVTYSGTESVVLSAQNGNVKLGADELAIPAANVKTIEVLEDPAGTGANTVDLSAVDSAAYTQLTSTLIRAAGGADTLTGSQLDDRIEGARQNDTMSGKDGDDTLVWNNGDGSDVMNGGDGIDTIENNGADVGSPAVDETYTVETAGKRFLFKRISAGPFSLDVGGAERYVNNLKGGDDKFSTADPTKPVAGIAVTLNGEAGNDALTGTNGDDTINGGAGNDSLVGFRGNDTKNGDDGDDVLTWNPGDGSDRFEGGAGNDVAVDNGGGAAENFVVSANGQRVTATRDSGAPFFLDIGTSETLDLNTGGGDDTVDVNKGLAALLKVDVDLGDGNDSIEARNDSAQTIDGGAGTDSAQVDATDVLANVENVDAPAVVTPPPPADTVAPNAAIVSKNLKVKRGKARVELSLPAGESASEGRITIKRRGKVVGSKAIALAGGETKTVKVALDRKTRNALADGKKLRATVKIELTDAAGNTGSVSQRLALKR